MEYKSCPQCNGEMWDNRGRKNNPKAPDFKCKNKQCNHAIWPPKEQKDPIPQVNKPEIPQKRTETPQINDNSYRAMIMAYSKDLVVARVCNGETVEHTAKSTIQTFRLLYREYSNPFSVKFTEDNQEEDMIKEEGKKWLELINKCEEAKDGLGRKAYYELLSNMGFEIETDIKDIKMLEKFLEECRAVLKMTTE